MELCQDCIENCCDDCADQDCACSLANHSLAAILLVRDALSALNSETAYVNTDAIVSGKTTSHMDILVNGNIFRVTLETIRCEQPD